MDDLHTATKSLILNLVGSKSFTAMKTAEGKIISKMIPVEEAMFKFMKAKFSTYVKDSQLATSFDFLSDSLELIEKGETSSLAKQ